MRRQLALAVLACCSLVSITAFSQSSTGCLSTAEGTFQWTLSTTPETPNWTISSVGSYTSQTPSGVAVTSAVPFSATFWRRAACNTQLVVTFNIPSPAFTNSNGWYLVQNGTGHGVVEYWQGDPAHFSYTSNSFWIPPVGLSSGLIPLFSFDGVDLSQPLQIQYDRQQTSARCRQSRSKSLPPPRPLRRPPLSSAPV